MDTVPINGAVAPKDPTASRRMREWRARNKKAKESVTENTEPVTAPVTEPVTEHVTAPPPRQKKNTSETNSLFTDSDKLPRYASQDVTRNIAPSVTYARPLPMDDGRSRAGGQMSVIEVAVTAAALSLAGVAAWMSVHGMVTLFPGMAFVAGWLGVSLEGAKLATAAWLGKMWDNISWLSRIILSVFTIIVAALNAVSVYSQLVAAHTAPHGAEIAAVAGKEGEAQARIDAAQGKIDDINRRQGVLDDVARKAKGAVTAQAIDKNQKPERAALSMERDKASKELAAARAEKAGTVAKGRSAATEALTVAYLAELLGISAGGEEVIRWFIAGIVAAGDPFAICLAAALSGRHRQGRAV